MLACDRRSRAAADLKRDLNRLDTRKLTAIVFSAVITLSRLYGVLQYMLARGRAAPLTRLSTPPVAGQQTIVFCTRPGHPAHPVNYTRAGLLVRFRQGGTEATLNRCDALRWGSLYAPDDTQV